MKALLETIEKPREIFNHQQNRADPAPAHSGSPGKSPRSAAAAAAGKKHKKKASLVTYLNVHAGVSIGVMAGMDVGAQDRFEVNIICVVILNLHWCGDRTFDCVRHFNGFSSCCAHC